jgi:hypothetical protein
MFDGEGAVGTVTDAGAATEVVTETPGDAGGGEGGGAPGGTPGEVVEGEPGEPGEGDEPAEPGEPGEGDEDPLGDLDADGRKVDNATRKTIAELKKTNPAAAKQLADNYFRRKAYETEFPTVQAARQAKATLDSLGGDEGITEMQTEVEDYRNEIQQFANGDPALLEQLEKANPQSFDTAMTNGLERIVTSGDLTRFDNVMAGPMAARLRKAELPQSIAQAVEHVKKGEGQAAYDLLSNIDKWLKGLDGHAKKQLDMKTARNPEKEANDRRAQELDSKEAKMYTDGVTSDVNRMNAPALRKVTADFFKAVKLSTQGQGRFNNQLTSEVWKAMQGDKAYMRAAQAIRKTGDRDRHARFVHAKFREVLPTVFRTLRNELYPSYKPVVGRPGGTNGAPAKKAAPGAPPPAKAVAGKLYPRSAVDIMTTPDVLLATGRAYLKGTKDIVHYQR